MSSTGVPCNNGQVTRTASLQLLLQADVVWFKIHPRIIPSDHAYLIAAKSIPLYVFGLNESCLECSSAVPGTIRIQTCVQNASCGSFKESIANGNPKAGKNLFVLLDLREVPGPQEDEEEVEGEVQQDMDWREDDAEAGDFRRCEHPDIVGFALDLHLMQNRSFAVVNVASSRL
eukprot:395384-Amphidinium_carterae.2